MELITGRLSDKTFWLLRLLTNRFLTIRHSIFSTPHHSGVMIHVLTSSYFSENWITVLYRLHCFLSIMIIPWHQNGCWWSILIYQSTAPCVNAVLCHWRHPGRRRSPHNILINCMGWWGIYIMAMYMSEYVCLHPLAGWLLFIVSLLSFLVLDTLLYSIVRLTWWEIMELIIHSPPHENAFIPRSCH